MMLSDPAERMDSMSLLTYMAPVAVLTLIPTTLIFESGSLAAAFQLGRDGSESWDVCAAPRAELPSAGRRPHPPTHCPACPRAEFWGLLAVNSFMAYFVNLTNFLVTKHTSALTLQVGWANKR